VSRFAVLSKKFRHKVEHIKPIIESIMSLQNIVLHDDMVQQFVFKLDPPDWEGFLAPLECYLNEDLVFIENEVSVSFIVELTPVK
jgi:hypothetical protein